MSRLCDLVWWKLSLHRCDAGKAALKVAADSAKDAAAGKDDEQSPRRGDSAGKRLAKRGSRPAKQVWPLRHFRLLVGNAPWQPHCACLCALVRAPFILC